MTRGESAGSNPSLDVLAFGAHPDDVELTCGGTVIKLVRRGYRVGVAALSGGELGTRGDLRTREMEFESSSRHMGLAFHRILGLPDGGLGASPDQKRKVAEVIREARPKIVFAPYWEDRHPDHSNSSPLVWEAAFLAGLRRFDAEGEAWRPYRVLFYPSRFEFKPSFVVDVSDTHEAKMEAVRLYRSQFSGTEGNPDAPETNISRPEFLDAVITRARQYGSYIGTEFGEPFLVREPLRLDDPVAFFGPESLNSFV